MCVHVCALSGAWRGPRLVPPQTPRGGMAFFRPRPATLPPRGRFRGRRSRVGRAGEGAPFGASWRDPWHAMYSEALALTCTLLHSSAASPPHPNPPRSAHLSPVQMVAVDTDPAVAGRGPTGLAPPADLLSDDEQEPALPPKAMSKPNSSRSRSASSRGGDSAPSAVGGAPPQPSSEGAALAAGVSVDSAEEAAAAEAMDRAATSSTSGILSCVEEASTTFREKINCEFYEEKKEVTRDRVLRQRDLKPSDAPAAGKPRSAGVRGIIEESEETAQDQSPMTQRKTRAFFHQLDATEQENRDDQEKKRSGADDDSFDKIMDEDGEVNASQFGPSTDAAEIAIATSPTSAEKQGKKEGGGDGIMAQVLSICGIETAKKMTGAGSKGTDNEEEDVDIVTYLQNVCGTPVSVDKDAPPPPPPPPSGTPVPPLAAKKMTHQQENTAIEVEFVDTDNEEGGDDADDDEDDLEIVSPVTGEIATDSEKKKKKKKGMGKFFSKSKKSAKGAKGADEGVSPMLVATAAAGATAAAAAVSPKGVDGDEMLQGTAAQHPADLSGLSDEGPGVVSTSPTEDSKFWSVEERNARLAAMKSPSEDVFVNAASSPNAGDDADDASVPEDDYADWRPSEKRKFLQLLSQGMPPRDAARVVKDARTSNEEAAVPPELEVDEIGEEASDGAEVPAAAAAAEAAAASAAASVTALSSSGIEYYDGEKRDDPRTFTETNEALEETNAASPPPKSPQGTRKVAYTNLDGGTRTRGKKKKGIVSRLIPGKQRKEGFTALDSDSDHETEIAVLGNTAAPRDQSDFQKLASAEDEDDDDGNDSIFEDLNGNNGENKNVAPKDASEEVPIDSGVINDYADGMSVGTGMTGATSKSTRTRHRGAAAKRQAKAREADSAGSAGWLDSMRAAAVENNRVWDAERGWVDYTEPESMGIGKAPDEEVTERIGSLHLAGKVRGARGAAAGVHTENAQSTAPTTVPFPKDWEKERSQMIGQNAAAQTEAPNGWLESMKAASANVTANDPNRRWDPEHGWVGLPAVEGADPASADTNAKSTSERSSGPVDLDEAESSPDPSADAALSPTSGTFRIPKLGRNKKAAKGGKGYSELASVASGSQLPSSSRAKEERGLSENVSDYEQFNVDTAGRVLPPKIPKKDGALEVKVVKQKMSEKDKDLFLAGDDSDHFVDDTNFVPEFTNDSPFGSPRRPVVGSPKNPEDLLKSRNELKDVETRNSTLRGENVSVPSVSSRAKQWMDLMHTKTNTKEKAEAAVHTSSSKPAADPEPASKPAQNWLDSNGVAAAAAADGSVAFPAADSKSMATFEDDIRSNQLKGRLADLSTDSTGTTPEDSQREGRGRYFLKRLSDCTSPENNLCARPDTVFEDKKSSAASDVGSNDGFGAKSSYLEAVALRAATKNAGGGSVAGSAISRQSSGAWQDFVARRSASKSFDGGKNETGMSAEDLAASRVEQMMAAMSNENLNDDDDV